MGRRRAYGRGSRRRHISPLSEDTFGIEEVMMTRRGRRRSREKIGSGIGRRRAVRRYQGQVSVLDVVARMNRHKAPSLAS